MAVDGLDIVIVGRILSGGTGSHYHTLDKGLDLYPLAFEARVATRWAAGPARPAGLAGLLARGGGGPGA